MSSAKSTMSVSAKHATRSSTPRTGGSSTKPWFYNYDGPEDDAGVLPTGVKYFPARKDSPEGWEARQGNGPWRGFISKDDAYAFAGAKMRPCPLDGCMVPEGDVSALCRYLADKHPGEWARLKRKAGGRVRTLYVYDDCYDTERRWINKKIHGRSFATKEDLDRALKRVHPVPLHPEIECRNLNCHGKDSGGCAFNHPDKDWCSDEKSHESRCSKVRCPDNHGRGRVKYVSSAPSTPKSSPSRERSPPPAPSKPKPKETNRFSRLDDTVEDLSSKMEEAVVSPKAEQSEPCDNSDDEGFTLVGKKQRKQPPQSKQELKLKSKPKPKPKEQSKTLPKPLPKPRPKLDERAFPSLEGAVVTAPAAPQDWHAKIEARKKADLEAKEAKEKAERLEREAKEKAERLEREAQEEAERLEREAQEETERLEREARMKQFEGMKCVPQKEDDGLFSGVTKKTSKKASKNEKKRSKREDLSHLFFE